MAAFINSLPVPIVPNGLLLYLDAGNQASYPGGGTVWNDLTRNKNNATLINGPTFSTADRGSIVFDGINDGAPTSYNASALQVFTALAWIKTTNTTGDNFVFSAGSYNSPIIAGFGLHIVSNGLILDHCAVENVGGYTFPSIYDGTWRQVGIYRNANNQAGVIINGIMVTSVSYTASFTNSIFNVGYRPGGGPPAFFGGNISNVQLYERGLSASEILQNYNAQKSRFGL
jgi:hypothetical protein